MTAAEKPTLIPITPELYAALKRLTIHAAPGTPKSEIREWLLARQKVAKWIDEVVTPAMAERTDME